MSARHTDPIEGRQPQMAASISVSACSCGSIYIRLHNDDGNIYAVGSMALLTASQFVDQVLGHIQSVVAVSAPKGCVH